MLPKIMILSDIHGGYYNLDRALAYYEKEKFERLFVLGDLFGYSFDETDDEILKRIREVRNSVIVRGNCDGWLEFEDIRELVIDGTRITLTHGHKHTLMSLLRTDADIICVGHSHIPVIKEYAGKIIINPGSVARSRSGPESFATIEDGIIRIRDLDYEVLEEMKL